MSKNTDNRPATSVRAPWATVALAALMIALPSVARALELRVVDATGASVTAFRWLLEEDQTWHVTPGDPATNWAVQFHKSYMPVVATGDESTALTIATDSTQHYFLSVLPDAGFTLGGAAVKPGQTAVTVKVDALPIPTAQISVFVFNDNFPINNAPDTPEEQGLAGFSIILEDAGGRYGMSAGVQAQDAFGNPLGTTYDAAGNLLAMGTGMILTDANGLATVKYLSPGKYGVTVVPPRGSSWVQTSTIEGKKVIDAWVQADEPAYFREFGPPGYHVFIGFVQPMIDATALNGSRRITGQVVNQHLSRPPETAFYSGAPFVHTTPWVGLNLGAAGAGRGVYAQPCNPDGTFEIRNVPPGDYQLVVWDDALDLIFALIGVTVPATSDLALGDVPVFQWFSRLENHVFFDRNQNGFRDCVTAMCDDVRLDDVGMPDQAVNLRWRDGSMYQSSATDTVGFVPFDEVFPFFNWLVAEVDFARFKATGATITVDQGGPIDVNDPWSFGGVLNPQLQPDNGNLPYRVEQGPVLTQAFQTFLGQTSVIQWGKAAYARGENGGISGIVFYSVTRAENDPRFGAGEPWEPGIPGVQVNLYDSTGTLLLNSVTTDSWDASLPGGCPGDPLDPFYFDARCYDGMRNWNQVRPGIFDGGYAFNSYFTPYFGAADAVEVDGLPVGEYVVEVVPPAGYEIVKEEDKNVDFGETYIPSVNSLPPLCVGADHLVPAQYSLFPLLDDTGANVPPVAAGTLQPLCDRKAVPLSDGQNAAADFFLFTPVPIAGHIVGMILDDTANEFDPTSPQFGEKFAPPWLPVSIRDWTGSEIARVYGDQYGLYNALVPSTYTANRPAPSGMSPNMLTVCINDAGSLDAATGLYVPDPYFNPQYSQFCYTFQYMPGTTTYLDTPVVKVAAFAGPGQFPVDCRAADGTPEIAMATGVAGIGPYVSSTGELLTVYSSGFVEVPNPAYEGPGSTTPKTILRDFGFGDLMGEVWVGGVALTDVVWTADAISGVVATGTETGELVIVRGDTGLRTQIGLTVTVGSPYGNIVTVTPATSPTARPIQAAIDNALPGDLILVAPGYYPEQVIMWKPVKLQGWGAATTVISAAKIQANQLAVWRAKAEQLFAASAFDLLPAQEGALAAGIEPVLLFDEEGAGILVLARDVVATQGGFGLQKDGIPNARIDGLTVTSADHAGGIVVNGYARRLQVSNNRIANNTGLVGGGIRIGQPLLTQATNQGIVYADAENDGVSIFANEVVQNGAIGAAGGGIAIGAGADGYAITDNFVCGNFVQGDGAGISHVGLSHQGLVARNTIAFNQSFNQGLTVSGGGLFIGGGAPLNGPTSLTAGAGSVRVVGNVIQGNLAGAGDGGGIRLERVNGEDVRRAPNRFESWYLIDVVNNMIVNNVAGLAGGGLSLQDAAYVRIVNNTIANNDSTATAGEAFTHGPSQSEPQPAGIVSRAHTSTLVATIGTAARVATYKRFSNPLLVNDIIWHNRSFHFVVDTTVDPTAYRLAPDLAAGETPVYTDLAVLGTLTPASLSPQSCLLSTTAGASPAFVAEYTNGARNSVIIPEITSVISVPPAFDEGGNFIDVAFGPLTLVDPASGALFGDYHVSAASTARNVGLGTVLTTVPETVRDIDFQRRATALPVDIGADEYGAVP